MYDERIVKFKLRRGTNAQRMQVTFKQGELIYISDIKRCYVGDGVTVGGTSISNINYIGNSFPTTPFNGDIVYRSDLLRSYIYDNSTFKYIGPEPDNITINFNNNTLQVAASSITKDKIYTYLTALSGGLVFDNINGLSVDYDNTFKINNDGTLHAKITGGSMTVDETTFLTAGDISFSSATLSTYRGILTADGTFLIININGERQGIKLWVPPLIDVEPPGPPDPPPPPADTEFILAEDLSPIISNDDDNIVWTAANRNYLVTESDEYIMTEDTDDILWEI